MSNETPRDPSAADPTGQDAYPARNPGQYPGDNPGRQPAADAARPSDGSPWAQPAGISYPMPRVEVPRVDGPPAAPMPTSSGGVYRPPPMPYRLDAGEQAGDRQGGQNQGTTTYSNADWGQAWQVGAVQAPAVAPADRPVRGRRTAALVAATVVLALGAGIGGGWLGADLHQRNTSTGASVASSDRSLTQQTPAETASTSTAPGQTGTVESVAATVLPSVVSVVATSASSAGEGSGVILTQDGYILTNNHVIDRATTLSVRFNDGTTATATVVGADSTGDLAVIKVTGVSGLVPAVLGTSAAVKVGESVIAIGSPLGLSATVTSGIVSALNRPVRTSTTDTQSQQNPFGNNTTQTASGGTVLSAIQTDAAINPGNSGGPLLNMQGQVIGINSAIASLSSGSSEVGSIGVGFAIPIDSAARIAQEIMKTGSSSHAVLGASVTNATDGAGGLIPTGAEIRDVTAGGAAEAAGLKVGDVITAVNGNLIESADALVATIRSSTPNSQIQVTRLRGTSSEQVTVTLGSAKS